MAGFLHRMFFVDLIGNTPETDAESRHAFTANPKAKSSSCCIVDGRLRAPSARSRTCSDAARYGALRVWRAFGFPIFPDKQYRFAALRHGKRRVGGNCDYRQRGSSRNLFVYGRRKHAEPCGSAKRRQRLSAQGEYFKKGIRARGTVRTLGAALHAGAYYPDGADGSVQPASYGGSATMPLAVVEPGSITKQ
jgi:hypothetical protein